MFSVFPTHLPFLLSVFFQGPPAHHDQRVGRFDRSRHRGVPVSARAPLQRRGDGKLGAGGEGEEETVQAHLPGQRL